VFDFLYSKEGKLRRSAAQWLEMAERVRDYRRDQLNEAQMLKLQTATGDLQARLKEKAGVPVLTKAIEKLEVVMREVGGRIYPATSLVENVDFFLVAAIVILGMRAYFVQPFKIPTNSMYPTYYGMTHQLDKPGQETNLARMAWRTLTLGAWHYSVKAPQEGELMLPVFADGPMAGQMAFTQKPGRNFFVFPSVDREFRFGVGDQEVSLTVPGPGTGTEDFRYDRALDEMLATQGDRGKIFRAYNQAVHTPAEPEVHQTEMEVLFRGQRNRQRVWWLPTGRMVKRGEPILSFDILTGDMLFVDRITYNFFPPKVGQGFVFHTRQIPGIGVDQYYVKRLVGVSGDVMEVRKPVPKGSDGESVKIGDTDGQLFRNGQPISGADAFNKNANKEGLYPGYTASGLLEFGQTLKVPDKMFFAMGDNSPYSSDGRVWGFIPDKEVVGRPLFIYYPITSRWGLAK